MPQLVPLSLLRKLLDFLFTLLPPFKRIFFDKKIAVCIFSIVFSAIVFTPLETFAQTNYSGSWSSVFVSNNCPSVTSNYTLSAINPTSTGSSTANSYVPVGRTVTVTFPGGFTLTTITGGTLNNNAIGTITKTATTVSFATPVAIAKGAAITIVLNGIINNTASGNYQLSMTIGNATTGLNIFNAAVNSLFAISPNATINLTSSVGSNAQSVCVNTPISNITYSIGGGGTGATISGLPAGVSGVYNSGVVTISGTATSAGTYNYTINTTGTCSQVSVGGFITITPDATINLTSPIGSNAQSVCRTTPIANITYAIGGGGTGASVTGLPAGVNGTFNAGVFSINGIPSATGIYNYTVTTTGTCVQKSLNGIITVNPDATISLSSAVGTDAQAVCNNTAITDITYLIGGASGASVIGLPAGINGTYTSGVFTISGVVSAAAGSYNYTVNTSGSCVQTNISGTITIKPDASITLTSSAGTEAQILCNNTSLASITYLIGGSGTGAIVSGLPAGVSGVYNAGTFTIGGTPNASAGIYNYTVTTTGTCQSATATGSININALPQGMLTANGPFCSSGNGMLTWTSTSGTGPFAITYNDGSADYVNTVNSGQAFNLFTNPQTSTSTLSVISITDNNGCVRNNSFDGGSATITVHQPVNIAVQPTDQTACATFPVSFQVNATGDNLTYQWYRNGVPLSNGGRISGVTTNTLSYSQVGIANNGAIYHVVVSGAGSCASVQSSDVVLNVDQKISIDTQPLSQVACENNQVAFSVAATASDPLFYQWRKNGVDIFGATSNAYTIANVTLSDAADYDVVVSGSAGYSCPTIYSAIAPLTVNTPSVGGSVNGATTVCSGSNTGFVTLSGHNGSVLNWEYSTDNGNTWVPVSNITTSLNYTNILQTTWYRAVVQNGVCGAVNSTHAIITVNPVSVGGIVNSSTSVCSGTNSGTLALSGETGNILKWEFSTNGGTSWTPIVNTTNTQTYLNITQTTQYRAVVQSGICNSANSTAATITVNPVSVGGVVSGSSTVCSGSNSGSLILSGQTGNILGWEYSINGGTSWSSIINTTNTQTYSNITQTTQYRAIVQSGVCNSANSATATITVTPVSVGGSVSGSTTVCSGSNSGTLALNGQTGNILRWESSINGGTSWTPIVNTTAIQTYSNITQTTQYRVVVQNGVCSQAISSVATVTVDPVAIGGTLTPSTALGCFGTNNGSITLSGNTGSVIMWESSTNAGTTWNAINNTSATLTYNNLTQTTIFRAVVKSGVCTVNANSSNAVIVVNPTFTPAATPSPGTICVGQSSILSASGYPTSTGPFTGGDFNTANPAGWRVTDNGVQVNFPASADNQNTNPWSETNGPKVFNGITYNSQLGGKFAIANGLEVSTLETPVFSTIGLTSASLQFYQAFNFSAGTSGKIEISLDGGATYTTVLQQYTGPSTFGTPNGAFSLVSIPLSNYIGQSNLRIRFSYNGTAGSNWAIDNVGIPNAYQPITYTWTPSTYLSGNTGQTVTATPPIPGTFTYTVQTTVGGCPGGSANVTLTVNPLPVITASLSSQSVCSGSSITPVTFSSNISSTTYSWTRNNTTSVTGIPASGTGTISGALVNTTTSPVTVTFTITPSANTCGGTPITVNVIVNPVPQASISGSATVCNNQSVTLSINVTGTSGSVSGSLSNGTSFSGTAPVILVNVSPAVTTTYTISSLTNGLCGASTLTGTATVICLNGPAGLWTGANNTDWFNCLNWADGKVPAITVDVTIPGSAANVCNIDVANSPFASSYGNVAQSKSLSVDNNTLSFMGVSDTLITAGNVNIINGGLINMTNGGKFEVQGNWSDMVATSGLGFKEGIGNIILTGTVTQIISAAKPEEAFYNMKINKTSGIVSLQKNIRVDNNLILSKGVFATNNYLFTWSNIVGSIVLPAMYTDSYICTCNADGSAITASGSNGFRINNLRGNTEQIFPVSSDFVSPNRMGLNMNNGTADDFTVVVGKGDIGGTSAPKVNRIWYVNEGVAGGSITTMKLYFTKRNWGIYTFITPQNDEIETGFIWSDPHLVQKDNANNFINVSTTGTADVPNYTATPFNTEIFGRYFLNVSSDPLGNKNGINAFNKFSVVNIGNIILPVTLTNLKAVQKNKTNDISWTALNELNMQHYEVERSSNSISFSTIETLPARNNGSLNNYYNISDVQPLHGNNFYRIKAVDKDGTISHSSIVSINTLINVTASVTILPNPVSNKLLNLYLNYLPVGNYTIAITNIGGQQIYNQKVLHSGGSSMQKIQLPSSVTRGIYIVRLFSASTSYNIPVLIE